MNSTIIIANFNGADILPDCLNSLEKALQNSIGKHEVVVVDNGSSDGSVELIEEFYPWIKLIKLKQNTYIFALMDGVYASKTDLILFLNNDIVVEENFLDPLLRHFKDPKVFAVTARIKEAKSGLDQGARTAGVYHKGMIFYEIRPHVDKITHTFFAVGGQSAYDRNKLLELGGLDKLYWPLYDEDIDLSYQAWKRGWIINYEPDSVIHHLGSVTSSRVFKKEELDAIKAKNRILLVWKNITDPILFAQHIISIGPRTLRSLLSKRKSSNPKDIFYKGIWLAMKQIKEAYLSRQKAKKLNILTDREVFKIINNIGKE